jgi:hypothetical protein
MTERDGARRFFNDLSVLYEIGKSLRKENDWGAQPLAEMDIYDDTNVFFVH